MNQKHFWYLVLYLALLVFSTSFASALECSVTQNACNQPDETIIACLSEQTNALAELPQTIGGIARCPNYDWKICCTGSVTNECRDDNQIAWLAATTNAPASLERDDTYTVPICISGLRETKCSTSSFSGATCVLSLSSQKNADLAGCGAGAYSNKIYCSAVSDKDGDGFTADVDCDDDDKSIHPQADEIGDGLDNDCDGLLDGDDPDLLILPKGWYQVSATANQELFGSYTPQGIEIKTLETGKNVFVVTDSNRKGLVSQKVRVEKNKEYVARVTSSCAATLQLAFDDAVAVKEKSGGFFSFLFSQPLVNSVNGEGSLVVTANSEGASHASIFIDVKGKDCQISDPQFDLKGKVQPVSYNDAVQPKALPIDPSITFPAAACCPENTCWNGFACAENMREKTSTFEGVTEEAIYQCIDGNWVFWAKLYDWNNQEFGSCPNEGQCFVLSSQKDASVDAEPADFYAGAYPLCIDSGEYIFDHYCSAGKWLTRTQLVAQQLLKAAPSSDFTLYCTTPEEALISLDHQEQFILGDPAAAVEPQSSGLLGKQKAAPSRLCFPEIGESGKNLVTAADNTCINNVCLLQDNDGKIAFATTLNKEIIDPTASFVQALGISPETFVQSCSSDGEYKTCVIEGIVGEIYYSPTLNALIYSKEGLSFEPSFLEKIIAFFKGLFGGAAEDTFLLIPMNETAKNIYLLQKEDKLIRAFVEDQGKDITGNDNKTLYAQFSGFTTPVCLFVEHFATPTTLGQGVLGGLAGQSGFICTTQDGLQEIIATKDVDYLWPQLTGRLRVE
ncbi:hypothetical protein HY495_01850 [Candidatus Woesearchaeota archaeon]|nr:hypothetical protein [Candidatus Woesearchaeota archaeon]